MKKNLLYVFMTLATLLFTACEQNQLDNTQNTISCTPSDTVIAAEGGEFVVAISSSNAWSATTNQKWVSISPTNGQGDAYVTIQVAAGEQAEAKVLFTTGENTAKLTITRGEKQSSDEEEDPSNPDDGKTYPYLTIYDLMPLHLIPLADAESKLMDMRYTAEGVRYPEQSNLYFYYTTTNNDTITLFTSAQDGIVEDVMYIASKGIAPQDAKEWLMHIPESLTLPIQERTVEFSSGYAYNFDLEEEVVYNYRDWISFVRNHNYDNIRTEAVWGNVPEPETGDHVVSMGYYYRNNIDMVSLCIAQVREAMEPGESEGVGSSGGIGIFSVSADKQVTFSKGNLQYTQSTDTWSFASTQWEVIGTDNVIGGSVSSDEYGDDKYGDALADKVDLFGWSTSATNFGVSTSTDYDDYSGSFVDWGTNRIGNDAPDTWRTLSYDEWYYLRWERPNYSELVGVAQVNGVNGLIFLPDNWTCPAGLTFKSGFHSDCSVKAYGQYQIFIAAEWSKLEAAGAVFLPAAGVRYGSDVNGVQYGGSYWSAAEGDSGDAFSLYFYSCEAAMGYGNRGDGRSVRLVKDL